MVVPVLFDRLNEDKGQLHGRTPYNQALHVEGNPRLFGQIMDVEITKAFGNSLSGRIVTEETILKEARS